MNEFHEIQREIDSILSIPAWEWVEEHDEAIERLAKRKLEILFGGEEI